MVRRSRRRLVRAIRRQSAEERAALVAAAARARGADATVRDGPGAGRIVAASHPRRGDRLLLVPESRGRLGRLRERLGPGSRRVRIESGDEADGSEAAVTGSGVDARPTVAEPREVARTLLYAVDRDLADELCRRHLDRPLDALHRPELDPRAGGTGEVREPASRPDGTVRLPVAGEVDAATAASVAVALLAVLAGVTWAAGPAGVSGGPSGRVGAPSDGGVGTEGEAVPPTGGGRNVDEPVAGDGDGDGDGGGDASAADGERGGYPPGLGPTGVTSVGRLAASHASAVSEQSYVWSLTYRETADGSLRSVRWETVRVQGPGRYRTTATGWGTVAADEVPVSSVEAYGDGSTRLVRRGDGDGDGNATARRRAETLEYGSIGLYAIRSSRLVRRHLAEEPTRVVSSTPVDGRTFHLVYAGAGYDSSSPATRLTVDGRGMVHALRTRFPVAGSNVTAVVSFRYSRVNATTVAPPEWHAEAPGATDAAGNGSGRTGASTPRRPEAPASANRSADGVDGAGGDASREHKPVPVPTAGGNASRAGRGDGDPPSSVDSAGTDRPAVP
jgi:hypothetical protein